ncbi:MAG: DNA polymerase Y family protein [Sciscionella sp.]
MSIPQGPAAQGTPNAAVSAPGDGDAGAPRMMVLWCSDWPVNAAAVSAAIPSHRPIAVVSGNRIVACSPAARAQGIRQGMRRREAQGRCPEVTVLGADGERDARLFEPVVAAVEAVSPGVEVLRPGAIALPVKGLRRFLGGEQRAAELLVDTVGHTLGEECQVGIAEGVFPALLAARRGLIVESGDTAGFLASLAITELVRVADLGAERPTDLIDVLRRLGIATFGAFAALPERDIASRFGAAAVRLHRLTRGVTQRPPVRRALPRDLAVQQCFEPALQRVDAAAFAAKRLAEQLHARLVAKDLACTRLAIHAVTETGEELRRIWRCAEPLTETGITDRVRWQLEGWLRAGPLHSGVSLLRVEPSELVGGDALQLGLWHGTEGDEVTAERAGRSLVRVQGLLGPDAVLTPVLGGGRGPGERVRLVPWGDERTPATDPLAPWPGRLPSPSPSVVLREPVGVKLLDTAGCSIEVSSRSELSGVPHRVAVLGGPWRTVANWAGPWPVVQRWWSAAESCRLARLQVLLTSTEEPETEPLGSGEVAVLLVVTGGMWSLEGVYD